MAVDWADDLVTNNPFDNAKTVVNGIAGIVDEQFKYIKKNFLGTDTTFDAVDGVRLAVEALKDFKFDIPPELEVTRPEVEWTIDFAYDLPPVTVQDFGAISDWEDIDAPEIETLPTISTVNIPSFNPSITGIYIPPAPNAAVIPTPGDAPDNPGFSYPTAPVITLPDRPTLANVNIPSADDIVIPTLDDLIWPTLETLNINTYIDWDEPVYSPEIWTDVKTQILTFLAGGSGIDPDIEASILARGRDREDRLVLQQEMQATEEWAGKGYTASPGMLVKRLDNIREQGLVKKLGLNRELVIKVHQDEIDNLRFAVQQGIAAEQLFIQIHLAAVERLFMIERLHVEWEVQTYNLLVEAFKAKMQENQIRAQVYETRVRAALAEIEIFKALVDAERAKAEINLSLVQLYKAEIDARESIVNIYKAQVEAVGIQAGVFETEVKAYGEEVAAFAQRVNADKLKFDAYESRVRGEVAKVEITKAEAQAYAANIQGISAGVDAQKAALDGYVAGFRAEVDAYEALLQGKTAKSQVQLSVLQATIAGYQADTQRFIAAAGVEESKSKVELAAYDVENRMNLGWFEAQLKNMDTHVQQIIAQKALLLDAIKAEGSLASTIAAGGLAAMHTGASLNAGGTIGASGSDSTSWAYGISQGCSQGTTVSYNVETDTPPNLVCNT